MKKTREIKKNKKNEEEWEKEKTKNNREKKWNRRAKGGKKREKGVLNLQLYSYYYNLHFEYLFFCVFAHFININRDLNIVILSVNILYNFEDV